MRQAVQEPKVSYPNVVAESISANQYISVPGSSLDPTSLNDLVVELKTLEEARVDRATAHSMTSSEVATTLSTFLVMYEVTNTTRFERVRNALRNHFRGKSIKGLTLVHPNEEIKEYCQGRSIRGHS